MPTTTQTQPVLRLRPALRSTPVRTTLCSALTLYAIHSAITQPPSATPIIALLLAFTLVTPSLWTILTHRYYIYPDRIERRIGFIAIDETVMPLQRIITIEAKQDIIGRLFNFGCVEFSSAAQDKPDIIFLNVISPRDIASAVREHIHQQLHNNKPQET